MLGGADKGDVGKRMKEKPRPACRSYKPNRAQHLTHLPGGQFFIQYSAPQACQLTGERRLPHSLLTISLLLSARCTKSTDPRTQPPRTWP